VLLRVEKKEALRKARLETDPGGSALEGGYTCNSPCD